MPGEMSPQQFVSKWREVSLKERSAAQSHFNDLCRLLGEPTPVEADPQGTWYAFEAGARKRGGGEGFADVWKKGFFGWEYKGKHADLDKAYGQLLKYRESLENPPLLIVSDMEQIVVHTNFTNTVNREIVFSLADLLDPVKLDLLRCAWTQPQRFQSNETPEQVTERAAAHLAELADRLRSNGAEDDAIARFLIRLLFCLFAEDIKLLPGNIFTQLVEKLSANSEAFAQQLASLFQAMVSGGVFALENIPNFDGGLFTDASILHLDSQSLRILNEVSRLDWSSIEPSILGTLFERSLDPGKRAQLGAHYTSREDILLVVEPVLMAPLRSRWEEVQTDARELAAERDAKRKSARTRHNNRLRDLLFDFARELASVQVLDPACGSGNFLYVALRQLLDLWKEVSVLASQLGLPLMVPLEGNTPHPSQLHGIEISPYAHQLAQATIWIGYLQWLRESGFGVTAEPILAPLQNVTQMDAILAYDEQGRPVEPEWPRTDVIIGNPPFLGDKKMRAELGDKYVDDLRTLYAERIPGQSDLVCYWFERAREMIATGQAKRAGLLATQGIRGGANRTVLDRINETGDIFWAQSDRNWTLEGAAVNVSMVGFDDGSELIRELDGHVVSAINSDLTAMVDLTRARKLRENAGIAFIGDTKKGKFEIPASVAEDMLRAPLNPNGQPNSDVLRPWVNASDLTGRRRNMWIIDFGVDMAESEAMLYEEPYEYVRKHVKPKREKVRNSLERSKWWLHGRPAPALRTAVRRQRRYIATPRISKHRVFVWITGETLSDNTVVAFATSSDYFFGILHSRCHELWALRLCTHLETRPRYTPTTTFDTFPLPWPPGHEPQNDPRVQAIAEAARELVEKRQNWLNPEGASEEELKKRTLTNLYNRRPTWLELAHKKLDEAVFDAYGWPHDLEDHEILRRLLALNLERARST